MKCALQIVIQHISKCMCISENVSLTCCLLPYITLKYKTQHTKYDNDMDILLGKQGKLKENQWLIFLHTCRCVFAHQTGVAAALPQTHQDGQHIGIVCHERSLLEISVKGIFSDFKHALILKLFEAVTKLHIPADNIPALPLDPFILFPLCLRKSHMLHKHSPLW